ncbi:hypothetical protein SLA2020_357410 [Shorea laevis]
MIDQKVEIEADSDNCMVSQHLSTTTESSFENQDGGNRGGTELKKLKVRSVRPRWAKSPSSQLHKILSGYTASSEQSSSMEMSDASPSYTKATSSSKAKKESFQVSTRTLIRRPSFRPAKSLTRKPSIKFNRPLLRKLSGGTDLNKKLNKSRSIKFASLESAISFRKEACPHHSESSFGSSDQHENDSIQEKQKLASSDAGNKSVRVLRRTSTLRPPRVLTKMASLKSRRPSVRKYSRVDPIPDSGIERATCSSTLKDTKFPHHVPEIQPGEGNSEATTIMKVCPYSYCSLHGHRHASSPPLKRFASIRRRVVKTQKRLNPELQTSVKARRSGNRKKGAQTRKMMSHREIAVSETKQGEGRSFVNPADITPSDSSYPHQSSDSSEELPPSNIFITTEWNKKKSEAIDTDMKEEKIIESNYQNGDNKLSHSIDYCPKFRDSGLQELEGPRECNKLSSEPDHAASNNETENGNNFGLWHILYQHMVTGLAAKVETQPPLINKVNVKVDVEDHDARSQKLEFCKSDAIKIVQQAFDKILSEIPDNSSDDQSIASNIASDQVSLLSKQDEENEVPNISTPSDSAKESTVQDSEEIQLNIGSNTTSEAEKAIPMGRDISDKQMPKRWSNLKKVLILKRFVKAFEKLRNINPHKPHHLPMQCDPETEKIFLRRQTTEERKNAEEWMLDYALRQVISTLAPSQKRKVALLVQAFETVVPLPEIGNGLLSYGAASLPTTPVQANTDFSLQNGDSRQNQNDSEILLGKTSFPEMSFKEDLDQASGLSIAQQCIPTSPEPKELEDPQKCNKLKPDIGVSNCIENVSVNGPDSEECNRDTDNKIDPTFNNLEASVGKPPNNFTSASIHETSEGPTASSEEKKEASKKGPHQPADSTHACMSNVAYNTELEMQKNFGLWHLIYQHMVTGLAAKTETQPPINGVDSTEDVEALDESGYCQDISEINQVSGMEDHNASSQKIEFSKSNAIELVQQVFDKILSEIPDNSSDDQSIASDIASDQELLLKKQDKGVKQDTEKMKLKIDDSTTSEEEKATEAEGKASSNHKPKSWSNLKNVIVLKRFVKALEKVRNFNPRKPHYLPMQCDPEVEKVHLRHPTVEERKNADEMMLDYALRQVISSLAPSQKRKVALLVQAFETVIPLPETGNGLRYSAAAFSQTTTFQACCESSIQNGESIQNQNDSEILLGKTAVSEMNFTDDSDQASDLSTAEHHILPSKSPELKEPGLSCGCTEQLMCISASKIIHADVNKEDKGTFNADSGNNNSTPTHYQPAQLEFDLREPSPCENYNLKAEDTLHIANEKFPANEVLQAIPKKRGWTFGSDIQNDNSECNIKKMECSDSINAADEYPGKPQCLTEVDQGEEKSEYGFIQRSAPFDESDCNCTADVAHQTKSEKQKHMRLWYLIYKHMVSGSATEDGFQPLDEGQESGGQGDDPSTLHEVSNNDSQGFSATSPNIMLKNYSAESELNEEQQIEVIKLVEEAIDEIPLPENQDDSSDDKLIASDTISIQEIQEMRSGEGEDPVIPASTDSAGDCPVESNNRGVKISTTKDSKEERMLNSENFSTQKQAKVMLTVGNNVKPQVPKNWSNLKKLILLRRFVKALEKVKAFNPQRPQFLPLNPAPESEKVNLRHQDTGDRRNAEEWMLDHALQKVVAKLTPARKRRVAVLVEAFETVVPTFGS